MDITQLLEQHRVEILNEASDRLEHARLRHYRSSPTQANRDRLARLLDLVQESIKARNLVPIIDYAQSLARERFNENFEVAEVLAAINVLEESIWHYITKNVPASDYPEAFGMASTVLGAAKQSLATEYVSLASRDRVESIDLSTLFRGT